MPLPPILMSRRRVWSGLALRLKRGVHPRLRSRAPGRTLALLPLDGGTGEGDGLEEPEPYFRPRAPHPEGGSIPTPGPRGSFREALGGTPSPSGPPRSPPPQPRTVPVGGGGRGEKGFETAQASLGSGISPVPRSSETYLKPKPKPITI